MKTLPSTSVRSAPWASAATTGKVIASAGATLAASRASTSLERGPGISVFNSIVRVAAMALSVAQPLVVCIAAYSVFITRLTSVKALLLVGTVGSGKTTVLLEVGDRLSARGEPYALVDLDWLAWVEPAPASALSVQDILAANLTAAVETFRRAGVTRLVLARHLTRAADLASIETALGGAELVVVRLEAPSAELEARVRARDSGPELDEHLGEIDSATRAGVRAHRGGERWAACCRDRRGDPRRDRLVRGERS